MMDEDYFNDSGAASMDGSRTSISPEFAESSLLDEPSPPPKRKKMDRMRAPIKDPIHGYIDMPAICWTFLDTGIFRRLDHIKQLGTCYYVYPAANHSRRAHSIGVCHLAGQFLSGLQISAGYEIYTEKDKECVMLAGLCHDLGHGPFSHLWEYFVKEARPGYSWNHEQTSIDMIDFLIEKNNINLADYGFTDEDLTFVKELIAGPLGPEVDGQKTYLAYRGDDKDFLYEIIANKKTSIDVDKWDYFNRDNHETNIGALFDHHRYIKMAKVLRNEEGKMIIALADKETRLVQKMFADRANLHKEAYQHKAVKKCDQMVIDALLAADPHFPACYNREGNMVKMSDACDDVFAFSQLVDGILWNIKHSRIPELEKARKIIERIDDRKLYEIADKRTKRVPGYFKKRFESLKTSLAELVETSSLLERDDLCLSLQKISNGLPENNGPLSNVQFYNRNGELLTRSERQTLLASVQEESTEESETLMVLWRRSEEEVNEELLRERNRIVRLWNFGEKI